MNVPPLNIGFLEQNARRWNSFNLKFDIKPGNKQAIKRPVIRLATEFPLLKAFHSQNRIDSICVTSC